MLNLAKISELLQVGRQKFSDNVKDTLSYGYVKLHLSLLILMNASLWLAARFFVVRIAADKVALHYNVDFGIDYYGDIGEIYIIPTLGLIVFFINSLIAFIVNKRKDVRFLRHMLFLSA